METKTVPNWKLITVLKELLEEAPSVEGKDCNNPEDDKNTKSRKSSSSPPSLATDPSSSTGGHGSGVGLDASGKNCQAYLSRVLDLARKSSISQRWDATIQIYPALARQIPMCPIVAWKVGAQCLANHRNGSKDLLHSFANTMMQLGGHYSCMEIMLDYVIYQMSVGDFQDVRQFMDTFKKKVSRVTHKRSRIMNAIYIGFRGLLEYMEWVRSQTQQETSRGLFANQLIAITAEAEIMSHSEKAVDFLKQAVDMPGNVDVFIVKLIEILEFYDRTDEVETCLKSYMETNPDQPSPYIFMYEFRKKHHADDKDAQISVLKELAGVCPSSPYVLKLCELLPDEEFVLKAQLLFGLVDYSEWRDKIEVWKALLQIFIFVHESGEKQDLHGFKDLLASRSSWWPSYHFRVEDIKMRFHRVEVDTETCKAVVVAAMLGEDCLYTQALRTKLKENRLYGDMDYLNRALQLSKWVREMTNKALILPISSSAAPEPIEEEQCSDYVSKVKVSGKKADRTNHSPAKLKTVARKRMRKASVAELRKAKKAKTVPEPRDSPRKGRAPPVEAVPESQDSPRKAKAQPDNDGRRKRTESEESSVTSRTLCNGGDDTSLHMVQPPSPASSSSWSLSSFNKDSDTSPKKKDVAASNVGNKKARPKKQATLQRKTKANASESHQEAAAEKVKNRYGRAKNSRPPPGRRQQQEEKAVAEEEEEEAVQKSEEKVVEKAEETKVEETATELGFTEYSYYKVDYAALKAPLWNAKLCLELNRLSPSEIEKYTSIRDIVVQRGIKREPTEAGSESTRSIPEIQIDD